MIGARLTGIERTVVLALYERGTRLQRELEETQAALDGQTAAAVVAYGMDPERRHWLESRSDGEVYLVEQEQEPAEVQHDDGV